MVYGLGVERLSLEVIGVHQFGERFEAIVIGRQIEELTQSFNELRIESMFGFAQAGLPPDRGVMVRPDRDDSRAASANANA